MKNTKQDQHKAWLEAKSEREMLEEIVNEGTLPQPKYKKLWAEAIEREKNAYFLLTGKSEPAQKKRWNTDII